MDPENIERYVRCIRLVPGDGDLPFLSLEEARCGKNLRRVLYLTHEPNQYVEDKFPSSYYKVWIRSESGGANWNRERSCSSIDALYYDIDLALRFRKQVDNGVICDKYIDAVIMKFTDSNFDTPISMKPDNPLISRYKTRPSIIKWLNTYQGCDELAPPK